MICTKCNTDKPATDEFFQVRADTKKFRKQCRDCRSLHTKEYHDQDRKLVNKRNRDSYAKNAKARISKTVEYKRKKRKECPQFRIEDSLRTRVCRALKGLPKVDNTKVLIGCSMKELRQHLELRFTEDMTWDNYGDWHMGHIKPCCQFDLTKPEQQRKCFSYKNLQPLWAADNLRKGGK